MTNRQQERLAAAERFCLTMTRQQDSGFAPNPLYCPTFYSAIMLLRQRILDTEKVDERDVERLRTLAETAKHELFAWMRLYGIDPVSRPKTEVQRTAMEIAKDIFGPGYEGGAIYAKDTKVMWPERLPEDRARTLAKEFNLSEETALAIAAEIVQAEYCTRQPFVAVAEAMLAVTEGDSGTAVTDAIVELLRVASPWLDLNLHKEPESA